MKKPPRKEYFDHQTLRDERQYGLYWYSGAWRVLRPILIVLGALIVAFGLVSAGWSFVNSRYLAPVDPQDSAGVPFSVESGNSLTRVSNNLEKSGLIRSHTVFKYYCDFRGMGQKIQAGNYTLRRDMTIYEIAELLTTGDGRPITQNILIIPGWTCENIADALLSSGAITDRDAFLALCRTGDAFKEYDFVAAVRATSDIARRKYALEGYLSPNTYEIYTSATPTEILNKLLAQSEAVFSAAYTDRAAQINMTVDEVVTLASLIEKESKNAQFSKVSAVFHNRLKQGMKLQSDVTIHYVTGVRRMSLRDSDTAIDSPYNTYRYAGLPPGPICNPSPAAIEAALYPDETFVAEKYLYFCSTDPNTGELYFSRTLEEHTRAAQIYAPLWKSFDASRGLE